MASFRPFLRQRAVAPAAAAAALTTGFFLLPRRPVYAEAPNSSKKPIYDSRSSADPTDSTSPSTLAPPESSAKSPSPTDRVAVYIGMGRMQLHKYAVAAEDKVNEGMNRALNLEHSFTSTVASLAPPKESNERVLPGLLYVLVASMAGSIVTRNRNIVLRATVPFAVGLGAAYAVLPLTMKNVGGLVWTYEEKFPVLADNHLRAKERITRFVETGKAHTQMTIGMVEDKVSGVRETVEEWVKKGK